MKLLHPSLTLVVAGILTSSTFGQLDRLLTPIDAGKLDNRATELMTPGSRAKVPTYVLGADTFLSELEKELGTRLGLAGELRLTLAQPWKELKLPASDFAITITETPANGIAGTFLVRVKITSSGELVTDTQVSLRAQLWQEVWTAASRLERGQPLDRSLLSVTKVDSLKERQPPLLAEVDPSTLEVAQTVSASRPLTRRDVSVRPLIRKGRVVEVVAQQGQLAISMKALALESGASGDLIKLRNLESRKEFSGQILNENKVEVHF